MARSKITSDSLDQNIELPGNAVKLPTGSTIDRPINAVRGATRVNTDTDAIEYYNGTSWIGIGVLDGSSSSVAAPSASYIKQVLGGTASNGLYWIKTANMQYPIQVYCDMTYDGGGWMLLAYGYVGSTGDSSSNYAIPNLNHDSTSWSYNPTSRNGTNGLVASPNSQKSALLIAKSCTYVMFAAGNNPSTGGLDGYSHIAKAQIPDPSLLTFNNHTYYYNGSMTNSEGIIVTGLKGDVGTWTRYTIKEALGASWTDSYPTGYGYVSSTTPKSGNFDGGPFFPSIHSGSRNTAPGNPVVVSSSPDVGVNGYTAGAQSYTYRGWYTASGTVNNTGQTSIWMR